MRRILVCAGLLLIATAVGKKPRWNELEGYTFEQYVVDFKKPHRPGQAGYEQRKANFEENLVRIQKLNSQPDMTWRAGLNMFSDLSPKEFKKFNKYRMTKDAHKRAAKRMTPEDLPATKVPLPLTVDWRKADPPVLTSVKHQGACGSCWAHSATESIESQYALLTGMLPVLSAAQINSCTPQDYNCDGCDGGDYVGAWYYLMNQTVQRPTVQDAVTENWAYSYPLTDFFADDQPSTYTTSPCKDISKQWSTPATSWFAELTAAGVSGYGTVACNNATGGPLAQLALRDVGPQSISVASGNWQWYESGIMKNTAANGAQNEWQIDHAVQLVGYGYDKVLGENYWIVRNSWSTLWGEDGFVRLWRAPEGQPEPCGGFDVNYGQTVCGTSGVLSNLAYPIVYESSPTKFG